MGSKPAFAPRKKEDNGKIDHNKTVMDHQEVVQEERTIDAPVISKSWSVRTAHGPMFTGGPFQLAAGTDPFLLLPVAGDVCLVDAERGVRITSVRRGKGGGGFDDDDDDDDGGVDADAITAFGLSKNQQVLVTCSRNSLLRVYEIVKEEGRAAIKLTKTWGKSGHTLPCTRVEFHASGVFVATGSVDGTVRIWDVRGGFCTHVFRPQAKEFGGGVCAVTAIHWMNSLETLCLAIGRDDGSVCVHNLRKMEEPVAVMQDHVSAVTCIAWNEAQTVLVTSGRDAVVNLWKIETKTQRKGDDIVVYNRVHTLPIYEQVEGLVILPNYQDLTIATAGSKGQVRVWQAVVKDSTTQLVIIAEQNEAEMFGEARGGYLNLQYSPADPNDDEDSSEQLVVADAEHNITFLGLDTLSAERTIVGHNDEILDLKVLPGEVSSPRVVVATNSAQVRIFDVRTFSCHVLDRHTATVLCVDVSPCGRFISTCGKDKTLRIWHTATRRCVAVATGHTEAIGSAALSSKKGRYDVRGKAAANGGGSFCVTASMDRTIKRWNLPGASDLENAANEGELELSAFVSVRAHEKDINIVSIAPNDSYVATGSQDKTVKLWNSTDLSLKATLKGHKRGVWDCQFSPYDRVLATGSGDRTIKLWSINDFSCVRTFQGHVSSVLRVRFLSGGLQMLSSGADGLVKLWTIRNNECESTLDGHDDKVWAMDIASDGVSMVSGGADSRIIVWDDTTKHEEDAKKAEEEDAILLDQKLANHLRFKEYSEALNIALQRDKPYHALKVMVAIVEADITKGGTGLKPLKDHAKSWTNERLVQVLGYAREWNTRARNSHVAMLVLKAIVSTVPVHKLAALDSVPEILAGIVPYAERHFDRLDRLHASSYLLDFALFGMGSMDVEAAEEFMEWEKSSKLVLPPSQIDGRIQVGGQTIVGKRNAVSDDESEDDVVTIGDSDTSSDEE